MAFCAPTPDISFKHLFYNFKKGTKVFMSIGWRSKHWKGHWGESYYILRLHCLLWINSEIYYFSRENYFGCSSRECKPHCLHYQPQKSLGEKKRHSDAKKILFLLFFHYTKNFSSSSDPNLDLVKWKKGNQNPFPYILCM